MRQHDGAAGAHRFGRDDLVRQAVLQHPMLMDARFMSERVAADDRLVRLREAADLV
jgi:hypothetical protein